MANLSINSVTITIIAVAIGIIMVGSVLAPIASSVQSTLTETVDGVPVYEDGTVWASLVGITVVISILGLIIVAVNSYTKK